VVLILVQVPPPSQAYATQKVATYFGGGQVQTAPVDSANMIFDSDGLVDFDTLSLPEQRGAVADMLNKIPKISEMKKWLKRKTPSKAKGKQTIRDMDRSIPVAAWTILRW
jgi:ubiquitin-conjugating enzyme E2 Q